ncbi:MAG: hypothetical protein ACLGGV_07275 [Bacteroidia bacterium]
MRNKNYLFIYLYEFLFLLIVVHSCTIQRVTRSSVDDGSTTLTKYDSVHIRTFNMENAFKKQTISSQDDIFFEEIKGDDVKKLIGINDYTWVIVAASWCPHCHNEVPRVSGILEELKEYNIKPIIIFQNYDIKATQELLYSAHWDEQTYIIDAKTYGSVEPQKHLKIRKEICPECDNTTTGIPAQYIFNKKGEMLLLKFGEGITVEKIKEAINFK